MALTTRVLVGWRFRPASAVHHARRPAVGCHLRERQSQCRFGVDLVNVANALSNGQGLATVNPIFTWVRLAQRIPVRIHIDEVPEGVVLTAGMTATVQIHTQPQSPPY
jgi:hypothetical protein